MPLSILLLSATRVIAAARRQNPKAGGKNMTGVLRWEKTEMAGAAGSRILNAFRPGDQKTG